MSAQAQTVASVARRGYLDGWNDGELLARQVVKAMEELAELAAHIEADDPVLDDFLQTVIRLGKPARRIFDRPAAFVGAGCTDTHAAISEFADLCVVTAVMGHALHVDDAMYSASVKALADEARGRRKNGS